MSELADASALLWRLQLQNIRLGERWRLLADRWQMQELTGVRLFYVAHAMMAFAAAGRLRRRNGSSVCCQRVETSSALTSYPEEALMVPLCNALLAFAYADYAECVVWLKRVRHIAHRCGGSLAQCDLIHLTFTEAAFRARKASLARALVAERTAQKPSSSLNRALQRRLA
jgi:hypothetical protein